MNVVTFSFSASGAQTWSPQVRSRLVGYTADGNAIMTTDPALTAALLHAPPATLIREDVIFCSLPGVSAAVGAATSCPGTLNIPLEPDVVYRVQSAGLGSVVIYIEPNIDDSN